MKRITSFLITVLLLGSLCTPAFAKSSPKIVKVFAGDGYTIGLCDDGSIKFTGSCSGRWNLHDVETWRNIEALFIANSLAVGRKTDGSYISNAGPIAMPGKLVSVEMGVVGEYVFLMADGSLYHTPEDNPDNIALLYEGRDRLGLGYLLWGGLKGIEIGSDSAFGLKKDGTIITWPEMYQNEDRFRLIESWSDISEISMGYGFVPIAIKSNGSVVTVPNAYGVMQDTSNWHSVKKIYSESNITIGLCDNGRVYATGGEYDAAEYISQIEKWTDIVDIALSEDHVVGLKSDGTLIAVGSNDEGQCDVENWSSRTTTLTINSKYANPANSSTQYSTTQQFMATLDEYDVLYEYGGLTDADYEKVYIDLPGDNCEDIYITAFFGPDEDDVYFRIWNLIDFNSSDYRELLGKVNDLNDDYNFVTFLLDASDYSVTVKLDALLPADCGDMCLQYMRLLGNIADAGYPVLLPYAIQ